MVLRSTRCFNETCGELPRFIILVSAESKTLLLGHSFCAKEKLIGNRYRALEIAKKTPHSSQRGAYNSPGLDK